MLHSDDNLIRLSDASADETQMAGKSAAAANVPGHIEVTNV